MSREQECKKMTNEECKSCEYCCSAYAQDGFKFLTCKFPPYKGKWIAEISDCPKLLKGVQMERIRLIELIHQAGDAAQNAPMIDFTATLADYLLENGVVVPLVKAGDTLYAVSNSRIAVCTCLDVMIDDGITFSIEHICEYECEDCPFNDWRQDYSGEYSCSGENGQWIFSQDDIGKTVFLTQEEAEKALKELT